MRFPGHVKFLDALKNQSFNEQYFETSEEDAPSNCWMNAKNINWKYTAFGLLAFVTLFELVKLALNPVEPKIILQEPAIVKEVAKPVETQVVETQTAVAKPTTEISAATENLESVPQAAPVLNVEDASQKFAETKPKKNKVKQKTEPVLAAETPKQDIATSTEKKAELPVTHQTEKSVVHEEAAKNGAEKSGWDTFKDSVKAGTTHNNCTQAEIALGQCH